VERRAERERAIVTAGFERFSRYGYRRTSLEDIAREAGISRPAVYLHFPNKEAIFRAAARAVHEDALVAAAAAAEGTGPIAARIEGILEAKLGAFHAIAHGSTHAGEILDENSRLCGDVSEDARRRFLRILRRVIDDAVGRGELGLESVGLDAAGAAELIVDSAKGLESAGAAKLSPAAYRRRVAQLVAVLVTGMGAARPGRSAERNPAARAPRAAARARRA
jgi:AcrR family transcriptional regulator